MGARRRMTAVRNSRPDDSPGRGLRVGWRPGPAPGQGVVRPNQYSQVSSRPLRCCPPGLGTPAASSVARPQVLSAPGYSRGSSTGRHHRGCVRGDRRAALPSRDGDTAHRSPLGGPNPRRALRPGVARSALRTVILPGENAMPTPDPIMSGTGLYADFRPAVRPVPPPTAWYASVPRQIPQTSRSACCPLSPASTKAFSSLARRPVAPLTVTDPSALADALSNGIGHARAYGVVSCWRAEHLGFGHGQAEIRRPVATTSPRVRQLSTSLTDRTTEITCRLSGAACAIVHGAIRIWTAMTPTGGSARRPCLSDCSGTLRSTADGGGTDEWQRSPRRRRQ